MSDFITEIKKIRTDELIYALSNISILMHNDDCSHTRSLAITVNSFGIWQKKNVLLTGWDIPSIEYLSVVNSNDHRNSNKRTLIPELVALYRQYEDKECSPNAMIKNSDLSGIFKIILGMSSEQFQFQNLNLIFEKLNRDYHILVVAEDYEHRKILDVEAVVRSVFGFSTKDYVIISFMVFWLCSKHPDPLTALEELYKKKEVTAFTKENIEKFVKYYSCTYQQLRDSTIKKQLLYSKPFIKTQRNENYLSSSVFLIEMLLANGLYWLVRDYCREYYKEDKQKFPNAFGNLFEDYIKELAQMYCGENEWHIISTERGESADYIFDFDSLQMIVESKSSLLQLDVKQQVPNLESVKKFFVNTIEKSYRQLNKSYTKYNCPDKTTIKVILLYDEFSNTSIIESSIPDIFDSDTNCFVMTIRQFEILLYLRKNDPDKFYVVLSKIIEATNSQHRVKGIDAIFNELQLWKNPHLEGNMDYVSQLIGYFAENIDGATENDKI